MAISDLPWEPDAAGEEIMAETVYGRLEATSLIDEMGIQAVLLMQRRDDS